MVAGLRGGRGDWDDFITEECCSLRENQTTLQFCFTYSRRGGGGEEKKQLSRILVRQIPQGRNILELLPRKGEGEKERERKQGSKKYLFCSLDFKLHET